MISETTYESASALADHYIALGISDIWLRGELSTMPWHLASNIKASGGYRLNGPCGCRVEAFDPDTGLTFKWSFDFESPSANGSGTNLFDEETMLGASRHMSPELREKYANFIASDVLGAVKARTDEIREALAKQERSESILRTIIASA